MEITALAETLQFLPQSEDEFSQDLEMKGPVEEMRCLCYERWTQKALLRKDYLDILTSMHNLELTIQEQGRNMETGKLMDHLWPRMDHKSQLRTWQSAYRGPLS